MAIRLYMRWVDLAFLHWPIPANVLRALVPPMLELDMCEGTAWLAITPFRMTRVRPRLLPGIPSASNFPELNVRTYVRHRGRGGVYFFSLDAASRLAVIGASALVNLPYLKARMSATRSGDEVLYKSIRVDSSAPPAEFQARYRPTGPVSLSGPGSFEYWSTERYSLFSVARRDHLLRLDIEHGPWPLQPASVSVALNTMALAAAITLPDLPPRVSFAASLDVSAHLPVRMS